VRASAVTSNLRREPLFDVDPLTGATIEVFYADRTLETFGRCGVGWFWQSRLRGFAPEGLSTGPFATSYAAYRDALLATGFESQFGIKQIETKSTTIQPDL